MNMVRLGDACIEDKVIVDGKTSKLPYLGLEMIESQTGKIDWSANTVAGISTCFAFNARHILYSKLRPYLNKVALPDIEGRCTTEIIPLLPKEGVCRDYIAYLLRCQQTVDYITPENSGTRMPRADMKHLFNMRIPLPPLPEQRRITAAVERQLAAVEKARRAAEEQLEAADQLYSLQINDSLSSDNFPGCKWIPIGECTTKVGSGATPRGGQSSYRKQGIPLIRSQNIHFNRFIEDGLAFISDAQNELLKGTVVQKGDVLLNITGASIGRVCIVPDQICPANVNQHVCIIRFDERFLPEFVSLYMSTREFQKIIDDMQAGATRQALTKEQVQSLKLPLISQKQQEDITASIKARSKHLSGILKSLQTQLDTITAMPAAILRQAFSGQL